MAVCQWNGYNNNLCNHLYEKLFTLSSIRQLQLDEVCSVDHLICIWVKSTQSQESLWSHMGKLTCVNCRENKVIMSLSLYRLIPVSSSVMVKNEAPYTASCSFFFFDWSEWFSPAAHLRKTDDNAVGVIYCDFTKMNMSSTFSSCKCGYAEKIKK